MCRGVRGERAADDVEFTTPSSAYRQLAWMKRPVCRTLGALDANDGLSQCVSRENTTHIPMVNYCVATKRRCERQCAERKHALCEVAGFTKHGCPCGSHPARDGASARSASWHTLSPNAKNPRRLQLSYTPNYPDDITDCTRSTTRYAHIRSERCNYSKQPALRRHDRLMPLHTLSAKRIVAREPINRLSFIRSWA